MRDKIEKILKKCPGVTNTCGNGYKQATKPLHTLYIQEITKAVIEVLEGMKRRSPYNAVNKKIERQIQELKND